MVVGVLFRYGHKRSTMRGANYSRLKVHSGSASSDKVVKVTIQFFSFFFFFLFTVSQNATIRINIHFYEADNLRVLLSDKWGVQLSLLFAYRVLLC